MADDKTNRGAQDRARVSGSEQYEVAYFAKKHGLTAEEARQIIADAGPSRNEADAAAERRSALGPPDRPPKDRQP